MRAIILAAGKGSRLGRKSEGRPKALLPIGGRPLIQHQLDALSSEGIGPVVVVVGYGAEQIREALGDAVEYVVNERHDETNSLYSLGLAREWLEGEVLLLNSDLFFDPEVLRRLLAAPGNALAYDSTSHSGGEQTKVGLVGGRVMDLGKDFPATGARGENLGLIKLDAAGSAALRRRADAIIASGDEKIWVTEAVRSILAEVELAGVNVAGLPWAEIDFPYDLEQARRVVWPEIQRRMHPGRRLWRRARRPLLAASVVAATVLGWHLSASVGPASVDWETLTPEEGTLVRVQRPERSPQKWWLLRRDERMRVRVEGGAATRLEVRPVLPGGSSDTVAYAIELRLNGASYRYLSGHSGVDLENSDPRFHLGEREREEWLLPPGEHTLEVELIAGAATAMLLRVRQPEEE